MGDLTRRLFAFSRVRETVAPNAKRAAAWTAELRLRRAEKRSNAEGLIEASYAEHAARAEGRPFDRAQFLEDWKRGGVGAASAPLGNSQTSTRQLFLALPRYRSEDRARWWRGVEDAQGRDGWTAWGVASLSRWRRVARRSLEVLADESIELRTVVRALTAALRPVQRRERASACGDLMIGCVGVTGRRGGGWTLSGTSHCSSPWDCPSCAYAIRTRRAAEVRSAVALARDAGGSVLLGTATVRHKAGNDLRAQRIEYQAALKLFRLRLRRDPITEPLSHGDITGREVTHGRNGWHYHCHSLHFVRESVSEDQLGEMARRASVLWRDACVESGMAPEHWPSLENGYDLRMSTDDDYIAKLGLEVASIGKLGRGESRSPWEIARAAADGCTFDLELWHEHSRAMQGVPSVRVSPLAGEWLRSLGWQSEESESLAADETIGELALEIPSGVYRRLRAIPEQRSIWGALSSESIASVETMLRELVPAGWDVPPGEWGSGDQVGAELRAIYPALERRSIRRFDRPDDARELARKARARFRDAHVISEALPRGGAAPEASRAEVLQGIGEWLDGLR